jgi:hypothetical protein
MLAVFGLAAVLIGGQPRAGSSGVHPPGVVTTVPPAPPSPADPLAGVPAGGCYANNGTEDDPRWQADPACATGDFKVVAVEPGTTDTSSACGGVSDWDIDYPDAADGRVLCMAYLDASPAYAAAAGTCVFGPPSSSQGWHVTPCDVGTFAVVDVHRNSTDTSRCGSNSDEYVPFTVSGYPKLAKVLCLEMNFPLPATVPLNTCVWQGGPDSDPTFSPVTSCGSANAEVVGRIFVPDDRAFCGQYRPYTWQSAEYPRLAVTFCIGSPF